VRPVRLDRGQDPEKSMNSITLKAPAKVNLFLRVLSRRRDGYHNINTVFERISLYDTIKISRIPKGIVVRSDKAITKNPKDNLVHKAAGAMLACARIKSGVKIEIKKRIPIAAGLGGGSSDAAATVLGIDRLFGLKFGSARLLKIGERIGADVPFFLLNTRLASGRGIGGNLSIIDSKGELWHLLVFPGFKVDTKSVYKAFDRLKKRRPNSLTSKMPGVKIFSSLKDNGLIEKALFNDLERAAISKNKAIGGILKSLGQLLGKKFIVSGSGPSLFCLYGTCKEANAARQVVLKGIPASERALWRILAVKTA
jgi:4-diphosphocytidyl-2-C-methyl-D-erythritol kinase